MESHHDAGHIPSGQGISVPGSPNRLIESWMESLVVSRAASLARQGRLGEAEVLLLPLVYPETRNTGALDLLAKINAQQNQMVDAKRLWEKALRLEPDNRQYMQAIARCTGFEQSGAKLHAGKDKSVWAGMALAAILVLLTVNNIQTRNQLDALHNELAAIKNMEPVMAANPLEDADPELLQRVSMVMEDEIFSDVKQVSISQKQGIVQVSGIVPDLNSRYDMEQAIRNVSGVQGVDMSRLTITDSYKVKPGDSLYTISRSIYGTPERWHEVAAKNGISPPYSIYSGQILKIR